MCHSITKVSVNIGTLLMNITIQSHEWQIRLCSRVYRDQCEASDTSGEIQNIKLLVNTDKEVGGQ